MANEENLIPFVPGQSGNPKGKPKGARSLTTILRELLETEVETEVEGQKTRITFQESIIRKLLQKANKGEIKAITEILDRVEGKAKQEIKHEGLEATPAINIQIDGKDIKLK